jgi:hypothetical protein
MDMPELRKTDRTPCRACENKYLGDSRIIRELVAVRICMDNACRLIDRLVEDLAGRDK